MSVSKYCSSCRPVPATGAAQGLLITDPVSNLEFLLSVWLRLSILSVFPLPSSLSRILPSADGSNIIQACCYTCRQSTEPSHSPQQCLRFLLPSIPLAFGFWQEIQSNRCKSRPTGCKSPSFSPYCTSPRRWEFLTFWGYLDVTQGACSHDGALALAVVVDQQGRQVLIRIVWDTLCGGNRQELNIVILRCKFLHAGLQDLAAHHPANMHEASIGRLLEATLSWH